MMRFRWLVMLGGRPRSSRLPSGPLRQLGSEFMPPLEEGDLLYMPTTDPGVSMTKARELLQQTDKLIMQFPEVESVMGKVGRAETATDPAPAQHGRDDDHVLHRDKRRVAEGTGGPVLRKTGRSG